MFVGGLLVVLIPEMLAAWLYPPDDYSAAARADWIDSPRTGLLGVIALGSVAGWITQYRQSVVARTVDEYTERVRQLSQDNWEQVAAVRDLEQIASTNHELRLKTLQMLAVFIRNKAPRLEALKEVSTAKFDKDAAGGKRRPDPGVQEALRVIGSHLAEWAPQPRATKEDVADAAEDTVREEAGELTSLARDADIPSEEGYVSLADIAIDGAVMRGAQLRGLNLRRSLMSDVKLERADLSGARLRGAILSDADFADARLVGASLVGAKLNRGDLRGADLRRADLRRADLSQANISGAHLWGVIGLSGHGRQTIGTPHCLPGDPECSGGARAPS